jgi:acetyltransferase-like isoleucine patch superfamily enzyme
MRFGSKVVLYGGFEIRSPRKISIGEGSIIGFRCVLDGRTGLTIGENVNIGNDVMLWTLQHDYNDPSFGAVGSRIVINDRAWISTRAIILPGRHVGIGSVVAANCVVTRNTDDYTVVGGSPMRILRKRSKDISYVFSGKSDYWFV